MKCPTCGDDLMLTPGGLVTCINGHTPPLGSFDMDRLPKIEKPPHQLREFSKAAKAWHDSFDDERSAG